MNIVEKIKEIKKLNQNQFDYDKFCKMFNFNWSFLSDKDIKTLIESWEISIETTNKDLITNEQILEHINCWSVDVVIWDKLKIYKTPSKWYLDSKNLDDIEFEEITIWDDWFLLQPGQFYLGATIEKISIPSYITWFICGRSSFARLGLQNESAWLIDSNFSGTITYELTNFNTMPVKIYKWQRIAQIYFFLMSSDSEVPYNKKKDSKYQWQIDPTWSMINKDNL